MSRAAHTQSLAQGAAVETPVIEVRDLAFRWSAATPVVLALERLAVAPGERVFVEGPSGSGKSTLLSLLAGVARPEAGEVRVQGESLGVLSGPRRDRFRADHIGYIFQMFNLIPYLSMVENVLLPARFSAHRRDLALARSGTLVDEALRLLGDLDMAHDALLQRQVTALSVTLLVGAERVREEARESFANTISGTDLIVGARSGAVQLLLYSVFRIGDPTNNLS